MYLPVTVRGIVFLPSSLTYTFPAVPSHFIHTSIIYISLALLLLLPMLLVCSLGWPGWSVDACYMLFFSEAGSFLTLYILYTRMHISPKNWLGDTVTWSLNPINNPPVVYSINTAEGVSRVMSTVSHLPSDNVYNSACFHHTYKLSTEYQVCTSVEEGNCSRIRLLQTWNMLSRIRESYCKNTINVAINIILLYY